VPCVEFGQAAHYAEWFKVLAVPVRVQILHELAMAAEPLNNGELASRLGLGSSTMCQHLALLERANLVVRIRSGGRSLYRLDPSKLDCYPTPSDVVEGRPRPPVADQNGSFSWVATMRPRRADARA
jgi:DNA-binding transcriptional ArsR family regulator